MLARAKNNLGPDTGGFGYDLEPLELPGHPGVFTTRVLWGQALEGTARELLSRADVPVDPEEHGAQEEAKGFLRAVLASGPVSAKQIYREADDAGHAQRTLKRAKKALGVEARKEGMKGPWLWALPAEGCQDPLKGSTKKHGTLRDKLAPFGDNDGWETF